jgi:hypothetical protein
VSTTIIINDCHKIHIRSLFKSGQHHQGILSDCHLPFRTYLSNDDHFWLEIVGLGRWEIVGQPIGNNVGDHSEGWRRPQWKALLYVVGRDGKRCKFLLITPDLKRAGTRFELKAVFRSQWIKSNKRRVASRAKTIRQLGIRAKPNDLSVVFLPYCKPKGQHLRTYLNDHDPLFNENADPHIVLVRKPLNMKLRKFYSLINRLNRTRGRKIGNPVKSLPIYPVRKHRVDTETKELLERMARNRSY